MPLARRRSLPSLTVLVGLGVAACTSIIGLPDLPDAPGSSGSGGEGGTTTGGVGAKAGSGRGGSASGGGSGDAASSMGGSAARGGSTSGDAGESAGGDATTLGGEGNLPGTGGVGPKGGSSAIGGEQGDSGAGNTGTGGDSGTGGGGSSGRGTGGASSGAGGTAGSTAGAGTGGGAGTAGSGGASTGSTGCNKAPGIPANMYNNGSHIDITAAGLQRRYVLSVPSSYDNTHPYRLVIAFHWISSIDDDIYANDYYHLRPLANDSAIFVAPAGQMNGNGCTTASNCSWPNSSNTDLALVDAIVAELEESFCVDKSRIFVTGFSVGSSMAYKTACERALGTTNGYVRAVAVYSGQQLSGACTPSSPVAYYGSHGVSDSTIMYSQGLGLAQNFSSANGCSWATPTAATSGNPHVCTTVSGCDTGYPVKFCSFYGTHTADPLDPQQSTSWEYQATWDFLKQF